MTYAESGLFWSQCFLPSLVIRKAQAGAGKSSLGLLWLDLLKIFFRVNFPKLLSTRGEVDGNFFPNPLKYLVTFT